MKRFGVGFLAIFTAVMLMTLLFGESVPEPRGATIATATPNAPAASLPDPAAIATPIATTAVDLTPIMDYLTANFGSDIARTSWFGNIVQISSAGGVLVIDTSLYPKGENKPIARIICVAASGFIYTSKNTTGITAIRVRGQGLNVLASRYTESSECEER